MHYSDERLLLDAVNCEQPEWSLIAVDGYMGSGKTTLAAELARLANADHFDLDDFITKDQGDYVGAMQWSRLVDALSQANERVILSGICMLEVLDKLNRKPKHFVYVKRMAIWGWADEDEIVSLTVSKVAEAGFARSALAIEVINYHVRYRPHAQPFYEYHTSH